MSRVVAAVALIAFCITLSFAADAAAPSAKTFGKALTLKETTAISKINADPATFKGKTVLVTGKVVNVCQGSGCWLEVEAADSARIICKSLDESVHFPKDCAGSMVTVEGKVVYDAKATNKAKMEKEEGKPAHACPNPKVKVAVSGAELTLVSNPEKVESKEQVKAANEQTKAAQEQVKAANEQTKAANEQVKAANEDVKKANEDLKRANEDAKKAQADSTGGKK